MAAAERRLRASDLRSAADVIGYYVRATDGEIGHSEDLLINEDDWTIRYLVINTRNWWPGKNVVIAPEWLSKVDWATRHIVVDLTRDDIRSSPEYDPTTTLDRSYQAAPAPWPAILVDLRIALVVRRLDRPGPPVHFGGTMTSQ